ncbi:hypothetical protein KAW11_02280 [Candidatus Bathyarchaeota archaeon]|nr:hypothetical protein [Candidatus Bathyarchaeota archaeon]
MGAFRVDCVVVPPLLETPLQGLLPSWLSNQEIGVPRMWNRGPAYKAEKAFQIPRFYSKTQTR